MKKKLLMASLCLCLAACGSLKDEKNTEPQIFEKGMKFCESVIQYKDELLVANFGSDELDPLNDQGKGYVLAISDTSSRVLIPADGNLSAPKGMAVYKDYLFIADVGKLVVYSLATPQAQPQVIILPGGEYFANDLALSQNTLYVTVTNTGNIYALDVTDPAHIDLATLSFYTNITGANGIVIQDTTMYVASYPADGVTTDENVIYVIDNIHRPAISSLISNTGQYDGLALDSLSGRLYYTNWINGEVGYVNLATREVSKLQTRIEFEGPARMIFYHERLYIPDLPNSRVVSILPEIPEEKTK